MNYLFNYIMLVKFYFERDTLCNNNYNDYNKCYYVNSNFVWYIMVYTFSFIYV